MVARMKLLITGGAGFIGSNFARLVIDGSLSGYSSVTILDKLTYAGTLTNLKSIPANSFNFIHGDVCDEALVTKLVNKHDVVINFAAESHVDRSIKSAKDFVLTNVVGTQTLLEAFKLNTNGIFIQVSTDEVYGSISKGSWVELEPLLPNSPYAASKASGDLIARSYNRTYGLDIRVTRSSNNYGPHQFPEKLIPLFITNLIQGLKVPIYGNGKNIRDWLHVEDHCQGIHAVVTGGTAGEIYNIGGGTELSNLELTHRIINSMGADSSNIEFIADRLGHDLRYSIDRTKISTKLEYEPKIDFSAGLDSTIQWYRENESWWLPLKN